MPKTLLDLANRLERSAVTLDEQASRASIQVAETILADLLVKTPVDTSQALSNWQVSLNSPISLDDKIGPYVRGKHGSTWNLSMQAAYAYAKKVLQYKKPGDTIYISNVLPYIKRLNEGYSEQAPAGFVERAVLIGRRVTRRVKINLKG